MISLLKYFIPPIFYRFLFFAKGMKAYVKARNLPKVEYDSQRGKNLCVIGNGPSLKESFEKGMSSIKTMDCIVVNQFASTPFFKQLKPSAYLVVDGAYFKNTEKLTKDLSETINGTINSIIENVKWNMILYLPFVAYGSSFYNKVKINKHVKIVFFNNKGLDEELFGKAILYKLWNHNYMGHLGQTVLNTCIGLGIEMCYSSIYVIGADTSWHESYKMDQKTNELYIIDKHFYGEKKSLTFKDVAHQHTSTIHEELYCASKALKSYWLLADYARYNNVKVYNASAYSWIDAFERTQF